jgi:hypothetical protein
MCGMQGSRNRLTALLATAALVVAIVSSGAHVHGVGRGHAEGPSLTAPEAADSVVVVCLSCKLAGSPVDAAGKPAGADRRPASDEGVAPDRSTLPDSPVRLAGGSRAPPSLL